MKLKLLTIIVALAFVASFTLTANAQNDIAGNFDDDNAPQPVLTLKQWQAKRGVQSPKLVGGIIYLSNSPVNVYITPQVAQTSPRLFWAQTNAMTGLAPAWVPNDTAVDPAAWKPLGTHDLQWWHFITTSFHSHRGKTNGTFGQSEYGHRLTFQLVFTNSPFSTYINVVSSTPSIPGGRFNVTTNSGNGALLAYGRNYVGTWYGANNQAESFFDETLRQWVQVGDDEIYTNGENPAQKNFSKAFRYGSMSTRMVASVGEMESERDAWMNKTNWVTATQEIKTGAVFNPVVSAASTAQLARVEYVRSGNNLELTVTEGQLGQGYVFHEMSSVTGAKTLSTNHVFQPGEKYIVPMTGPQRFFLSTPATPQ